MKMILVRELPSASLHVAALCAQTQTLRSTKTLFMVESTKVTANAAEKFNDLPIDFFFFSDQRFIKKFDEIFMPIFVEILRLLEVLF